MKQKPKKVRKNIMVNPRLVERVRKVFNAPSDSQAIEIALEQSSQRKTNEELWKATIDFVKHLKKHKIKPLFS